MKKIAITIFVALLLEMQPAALFAAPLIYKDVERRMEEKEFDNAKKLLGIYISLNDKDVTALSMLGRLYQEAGDLKRGAQFLNKAIKIDPDYPPAHFFLGKNYYKAMKDDEAASEFAVFMARMGELPALIKEEQAFYVHALDEISEIYFNLKMYEEFYAVNQQILKMLPDDQTATYNMGVYYYVYDHNGSKAYQFFKKAFDLAADSSLAKKTRYAIEFMRANPDSRMAPDFDFIDKL